MSHKHNESPLDSLVRRTSSKRANAPTRLAQPPTITFQADDGEYTTSEAPFYGNHSNALQPLHSPLLHGHFARDSIATASSYERNSYLESASPSSSRIHSFSSSNVYPDSELDYQYPYDNAYEESIYSQPDSALRDSWHSTATANTIRMDPGRPTIERTHDMHMSQNQQSWDNIQPSPIPPAVVVSGPESDPVFDHRQGAGRAPVVKPVSTNFSRPVRPPIQALEEQKQQVLLRNSGRHRSESPSRIDRDAVPFQNQYISNEGQSMYSTSGQRQPPMPDVHRNQTASSSASHLPRSSSPAGVAAVSRPPPMTSSSPATKSTMSSSLAPQGVFQRTDSPASVYSNYSYYPYDSAAPSPTGSTFSNTDPFAASARPSTNLSPLSAPTATYDFLKSPPNLATASSPQQPQTPPSAGPKSAHDYLLLGIEHHEADRMKESAVCFERSAREGGGCGVGMLMWGLALRHGWGCEKNEKQAFKWLQKAAESAVGDLEATKAKGIKDTSVVRTELVLAIYEVGQCFFQGWGVAKDQKMAVKYYTIAAELGDADAQTDLAFCLTNGKGCKKDKRAAAKWYRAAIKQGQSDVGLAWIFKDKYQ